MSVTTGRRRYFRSSEPKSGVRPDLGSTEPRLQVGRHNRGGRVRAVAPTRRLPLLLARAYPHGAARRPSGSVGNGSTEPFRGHADQLRTRVQVVRSNHLLTGPSIRHHVFDLAEPPYIHLIVWEAE